MITFENKECLKVTIGTQGSLYAMCNIN